MDISRPLDHPAVWTGEELAVRAGWRRALTPETVDPHGIDEFRQELEHGSGIVAVPGFLPDPAPDQARRLLGALCHRLGTPVSQSAEGETIFDVEDSGFARDDPRSRGPNTRMRLSFHTDRADVTGFLCIRSGKEGGENAVASSMAVYNEILRRRPDLLEILREPFYYLRHTVDLGSAEPWCRQPVFSCAEGRFACCFLRVLIERAHQDPRLTVLTARQSDALDLLESIAEEPEMHYRFRQEAGDLVLINNWVVLHRREAFVDHPDRKLRRHILRVWLSMPDSRPIDPLFRENWGAVEAGAVRGGMRAASIPDGQDGRR
jgi:alpha-ketoglutarate-dependent taurine dioxygenase